MAVGPGLVIAEGRNVVCHLAEAAESRDVKDGETALPDIRAIRAGDTELRSNVLPEELIGYVLAHAAEAEHFIEDEMRSYHQAVSESRQLGQSRSRSCAGAVAKARAASVSKAECAVHQCFHDTVFPENVVILGAVPIDLAVDVVAIQRLYSRAEVVVRRSRLIG